MKNKHIKKRSKRTKEYKMRKHIRNIPLETRLKRIGISLEEYKEKHGL